MTDINVATERLAEIKARMERKPQSPSESLDLMIQAPKDRRDMLAALEAVLELHSRVFDMNNTPTCRECADDYPCPTVEAITEALGVDQ